MIMLYIKIKRAIPIPIGNFGLRMHLPELSRAFIPSIPYYHACVWMLQDGRWHVVHGCVADQSDLMLVISSVFQLIHTNH